MVEMRSHLQSLGNRRVWLGPVVLSAPGGDPLHSFLSDGVYRGLEVWGAPDLVLGSRSRHQLPVPGNPATPQIASWLPGCLHTCLSPRTFPFSSSQGKPWEDLQSGLLSISSLPHLSVAPYPLTLPASTLSWCGHFHRYERQS